MKTVNNISFGTSRAWWVVLIIGILMILSGFAYWFWPVAGYAIASQIFGWMLIAAGIVQLCVATGPNHAKAWGWWLVGGVLDIFIGFMLVRSIALAEAVFPYFLAFVFIFWGIEAFIRACSINDKVSWVGIINAILLCIIGFLFLEGGFRSEELMVSFLASIAFIYWGFSLSLTGYQLRPSRQDN